MPIPLIVAMLLTFNLAVSESSQYEGAKRQEVRETARRMAVEKNRRYAQIVDADGRIVDLVEV